MEIILENKLLVVTISSAGAEVTSIKNRLDGTEYIWTGDPAFWGRHAPILFPIIGKVNKDTYRVGDKSYKLGKHGFARDCSFKVMEQSRDKALLRLTWNEGTLSIFPYRFELDVEYSLGEKSLKTAYTVRNADEGSIWFSIGGHPGFNCPLKFEDYYFEFEEKETADTIRINSEGLLKRETEPFLKDTAVIPLSHELFKDDALIFHNLKSKRVTLKNRNGSSAIAVDFAGFPYLGLWSQRGEAPFVCIEPWYGLADYEDFKGDFREKPGVMELEKAGAFNCEYTITIYP